MSTVANPATTIQPLPQKKSWSPRSVLLLVLAWIALQFAGLFRPGLLDDVDSIYIEVAREMMLRHDYVTPFANGVRFFDKPPLMYWMAAAGMKIFGMHDWAARLPMALCVLWLALAVYALGIRFFGERGGFYSALIISTSIGTYLYTRFYIPDILLALWMTLAAHLLLRALDAIAAHDKRRTLLNCWGFAAVMALNVLTKGLIGAVFPIGLVFVYLALTRQLHLVKRLHLLSSTAVFLLLAGPWHYLAAHRNPPIGEARGWFWFYVINEHFMRFLGKRIPHDYGQVPDILFWLLLGVWLMPWGAFLPGALKRFCKEAWSALQPGLRDRSLLKSRQSETAIILLTWALLVLGFFSFSSRQEYYSLPALPALALMTGGMLAFADQHDSRARHSVLIASKWFLVPLCTFIAVVCGWFALTAPTPAPGTDIASLLTSNPEMYNLSLGHIFDLTGSAMGLFRGPLAGTAVSMLCLGLLSYWLRLKRRPYAATLVLAAAMCGVLLSAHEGLARFYPTLGSKPLADAVNQVLQPQDLILLDGEYTSGSSLNFYCKHQLHFVNGRVNGMWYGSFWPDAPKIFEDETSLRTLWHGPQRVFLLTYNPDKRKADLAPFGPVITLASSGGKTILTNQATTEWLPNVPFQ